MIPCSLSHSCCQTMETCHSGAQPPLAVGDHSYEGDMLCGSGLMETTFCGSSQGLRACHLPEATWFSRSSSPEDAFPPALVFCSLGRA